MFESHQVLSGEDQLWSNWEKRESQKEAGLHLLRLLLLRSIKRSLESHPVLPRQNSNWATHIAIFWGFCICRLANFQDPSNPTNPCGAFTRCNSSERKPISSRLRFSSCSTSSSLFRCSETLIPVVSPRHHVGSMRPPMLGEMCLGSVGHEIQNGCEPSNLFEPVGVPSNGNIPDLRISINPQNHHPTKLEISEPKNGIHPEIIDKNKVEDPLFVMGKSSTKMVENPWESSIIFAENPAKILRNPRKSSRTPDLRVESCATSWAKSCNSRRFWLSSWRGWWMQMVGFKGTFLVFNYCWLILLNLSFNITICQFNWRNPTMLRQTWQETGWFLPPKWLRGFPLSLQLFLNSPFLIWNFF